MKCHYEILGIARDANDGDIKIAYRKLALRWHPDKNPNNLDEAKEQFQLVQQAYEVLSDPHERSWYDNHREQILRGKHSDYEENCLDLFQFFTASCFKGYGDDSAGFYHIYADVFEKLATEDAEFIEDEEEILKIPKFGNSKSSYDETVGPFYAYWQSYCTKKNYAWLCPYNINEIKDRRILREIEKDMKKVVQKARKERNEEVRNLVSFVRKRDKRVQAQKKLLEERAAVNRQKQEQNRIKQIEKRIREMEESKSSQSDVLNTGYEEQLRQLEQEYGGSDSDETESESGSDEELAENTEVLNLAEQIFESDLYCVACNRLFKNENAFENHETSRKHRENLEKLKKEMNDDEVSFGDEGNGHASSDEELKLEQEDLESEEEKVSKKEKKNKKKKPLTKRAESENDDEIPDLLSNFKKHEETDWEDNKKSMKKAKNKKSNQKKTNVQKNDADTKSAQQSEENVKEIASVIDEKDTTSHTCVTCSAAFESKNKLFAHLKKTNHGVYIPKTPTPTSSTVVNGTTKKGRRK